MNQIVCVGAGRMGRGIALAYAIGGYRVQVLDIKPRTDAQFDALTCSLASEIATTLADLDALGVPAPSTIAEQIQVYPASERAQILAAADLVFEGVPETKQAKQQVLAEVSELTDAVIASTTSTMLADELCRWVRDPQRFLNAHWLNPAFVMPLVEVSTHPGTDAGVVTMVRNSLQEIGKTPVVLGSSPGFIVPRLQALIMNEAARMVEEGIATATEIDQATRCGLGLRFAALGVLEFIDFGGNDILFHASSYLSETVDSARFGAPEIIATNMANGKNGLRDGAGFYDYPPDSEAAYRKEALARLVRAREVLTS